MIATTILPDKKFSGESVFQALRLEDYIFYNTVSKAVSAPIKTHYLVLTTHVSIFKVMKSKAFKLPSGNSDIGFKALTTTTKN